MRLRDMIAMSLSNLWKRKVRTLLTVTGVVIGTCAIVVMISLGLGMQKTMQDSLAQMGDLTIISIYNYGGRSELGSDKPALDDAMLDTIRQLKYVQAVTPAYNPDNWNAFTIKSGKYQYSSQITGVDFEALKLMGYEMQEGQMPDSTTGYEGVVVFGSSAGYDFYNPKKNNWWNDRSGDPPVNVMEDKLELVINKDDGTASKKVKAKKLNCTGIMVEDWSRNPSPYGIFMDVNYLRSLEKEYNKVNNVKEDKKKVFSYNNVYVKVDDMKHVAAVEEILQGYGYQTDSMESIRKPLEEQTRQQQMIFGGLGAISLLVAALGITNTMIMSIYERTREIGVMKVLGCVISDIRTMFLMEAGTIGLLGGIVGVGISYLISFLINTFGSGGGGSIWDIGGLSIGGLSIIPWWLVIGALIFATLVGLVSGFSPANRAVKISALTAIRQE